MKRRCCNQDSAKMTGEYLENLVKRICATYHDEKGINHIEGFNLPRQQEIFDIITKLLEIVFPGFSGNQTYSIKTISYSIGGILSEVYSELCDQIIRSFRYQCAQDNCDDCDIMEKSENAVEALLNEIPEIRETMKLDIAAAYEGDPAAMSLDEIVVSYPGIKAITIQRLAHTLYHQHVPLIPRMMTEYAHSMTGIDIHPGAHLERGIFIDHGTGVVIGETAVIGNNVKIYQGVTLGALSFPKDSCGMIIKGKKRHPTLEDNVTIYAGATVLGDIIIGKDSVIGGNVWLTESIPQGTKVSMRPPEHNIRLSKKD
ncbi:MAG: serine O-acetyltransferase EpsC [Victivallaceae bacterium]